MTTRSCTHVNFLLVQLPRLRCLTLWGSIETGTRDVMPLHRRIVLRVRRRRRRRRDDDDIHEQPNFPDIHENHTKSEVVVVEGVMCQEGGRRNATDKEMHRGTTQKDYIPRIGDGIRLSFNFIVFR